MITLPNTNEDYLTKLALDAETPEDFIAARELLLEHKASQDEQASERGRWTAETLSEVAEFFGLAVQTVKQWRTEVPPMPGGPEGYHLPSVVKWRLAKLAQSDTRAAKNQQDLEFTRIRIEQETLDLQRQRGELVSRSDVIRELGLILSRFFSRMRSVSSEVATQCPDAVKLMAKERTEQVVDLALKEVADSVQSWSEETDPERDAKG